MQRGGVHHAQRPVLGHEHVLHHDVVAAGAAQADRVPDVVDRVVGDRQQECAEVDGFALVVHHEPAEQHPRGVVAAGREAPLAAEPEPAVHRRGPADRCVRRGDPGVLVVGPHLVLRLGRRTARRATGARPARTRPSPSSRTRSRCVSPRCRRRADASRTRRAARVAASGRTRSPATPSPTRTAPCAALPPPARVRARRVATLAPCRESPRSCFLPAQLERDVDQLVLLPADELALPGPDEDLRAGHAVALGLRVRVLEEAGVDARVPHHQRHPVEQALLGHDGPDDVLGRVDDLEEVDAGLDAELVAARRRTPRAACFRRPHRIRARCRRSAVPRPGPRATEFATLSPRFSCPWNPTCASSPSSATSAATRSETCSSTRPRPSRPRRRTGSRRPP